jgi:two-component system phosphate regulon response regulator PhoB
MVDAFASGADDYVVKPFRAPELGARILGLLRRARLQASG